MKPGIPLPEQYDKGLKEAVGALFLACAATETALGIHIARLAAHPNLPTTRAVTSYTGMDLRAKLLKINELSRMIEGADTESIERLTETIGNQFEHRNRIAHNFSGLHPKGIEVIVLKMPRRSRRLAKVIYTADQLGEIITKALDASRDLDGKLTEFLAPVEIV